MNLKIAQLVQRLKEMDNLSALTKQANLYAERGITATLADIELAVQIDQNVELTEELFNAYQKDVLHNKLVSLNDYVQDLWIMNDSDRITEQQRETYLSTIINMLNQRALI